MKKLITLCACAVALASCGSASIKSPAQLEANGTKQDTINMAPYMLGLDIGKNLYEQFDSEADYKLICKGIADVYTQKNVEFDHNAIQEILSKYMYEILPAEKAARNKSVADAYLAEKAALEGVIKSETGLLYNITEQGSDKRAVDTDTMKVYYTLYDMEGTEIESNAQSGNPMNYIKGQTSLIPGFVEGLEMLGAGGKITVYLPAELAYGEQGTRAIQPGAALQFDIEVVEINPEVKKPVSRKRR